VHIENNVPARSWWPDFDALAETDSDFLGESYRQASPFPHVVIDDLFPAAALQTMQQEFDAVVSTSWREYRGSLQRKRGTAPGAHLPPAIQDYFNVVYSGPFLRFLSRTTGIDDLIPDPALHGGGMHEVGGGGYFEVHIDFAEHPRTKLTNRLALITYLNDGWTEKDGGALELWELEPPSRGAVIQPVFGRTVIMEQSARAAHGHPKPVREGCYRRSAIAYFYTNGLATEGSSDSLATTYIPHADYSRRQQAELFLRALTPPIVVQGLKAMRRGVVARRTR
jgi:2OG-Fe(II) oxygenase superfamily